MMITINKTIFQMYHYYSYNIPPEALVTFTF